MQAFIKIKNKKIIDFSNYHNYEINQIKIVHEETRKKNQTEIKNSSNPFSITLIPEFSAKSNLCGATNVDILDVSFLGPTTYRFLNTTKLSVAVIVNKLWLKIILV